jgi:cell division protein FtsW
MFSLSRDNTGVLAKWWRNVDKQILFIFIFLFTLGLFFSFSSTSSAVAAKINTKTYFFFKKHFIFVIASLFLLIFISVQNRNSIMKFTPIVFFISIFLLFLVPFIGVEVKGSQRWLDLPLLPRFQPIELIKPLFVIYIAKIIIINESINIYKRYLHSFIVLVVISIFLINQPDLGQTLLLVSTWVTMIFVSGFNMMILSILGLTFLFTIALLIFFFPEKFGYIFVRIKTFVNPEKGDNFQSAKAIDAIKEGGLTGQGMGEGILKEKVPEAHTDYIIAVVGEEFGAVFILLITFMFLFIGYKVINKVFSENDQFLKLALIGLVSLLIIQTFIHIGVNIRLFPTTGMTLPFLSYGGSSLIGSSIVSGLILNFTRKDSTRYIKNE